MSTVTAPEVTLEVESLSPPKPDVQVAVEDAHRYARELIWSTFPSFPGSVRMTVRMHELDVFSPQRPLTTEAVGINFSSDGQYPATGRTRMEPLEALLDPSERRALVREAWRNTLVDRSKKINEQLRSMANEESEGDTDG